MSYGHGLSVNLVQLARAYSIFASDGELKPVTLFKTDSPVAGRPVVSARTARAVRHMLELATQRLRVLSDGRRSREHETERHGDGA